MSSLTRIIKKKSCGGRNRKFFFFSNNNKTALSILIYKKNVFVFIKTQQAHDVRTTLFYDLDVVSTFIQSRSYVVCCLRKFFLLELLWKRPKIDHSFLYKNQKNFVRVSSKTWKMKIISPFFKVTQAKKIKNSKKHINIKHIKTV